MSSLAGSVLLCAVEGRELSGEEQSLFTKNPPAGFTLFSRNISESSSDTLQLTKHLKSFSTKKTMIAIDQEGGRVNRVKGDFIDQGPAMELCSGSSEEQALLELKSYGLKLGSSLLELGVNVNFAPVVDVLTNSTNTAIGDRSFACNPKDVALRSRAFLEGQNSSGVLGCLKHFPGQGAAGADTHLTSAHISMSREELDSTHIQPFKDLLPLTRMVMISHCIYESLDTLPASLSSKIIRDLLVKEMGFDGLVVSDDFNMKAIAQDDQSWQGAIVEAMAAGSHLILVCQHLEKVILAMEALTRESQKSPSFYSILETAATRVMTVRSQLR